MKKQWYRVVNRLTGEVVATYPSVRQAKLTARKLNLEVSALAGNRPVYYVSKRKTENRQ